MVAVLEREGIGSQYDLFNYAGSDALSPLGRRNSSGSEVEPSNYLPETCRARSKKARLRVVLIRHFTGGD
jgi:hypothetical protein